jgi:hypothetical protein
VKKFALAASLALTVFASAQADVVEITADRGPADISPTLALVSAAAPGAARGIVVLQSGTSDLAEPEMLAMMLVGLVLIGFRATRDSNEKFK